MFQDVLFVPERNGRVRAAVLPLSVLAHGVLALLLVALPLARSADLPRLELTGVFLAPAPPAPPPPPPRAKAHPAKPGNRIRPVAAAATRAAGALVAPVDIPVSIPEEPMAAWGGAEDGVEGGVEGGVPGGYPRGVIGDALYSIIGDETAPVRPIGEVRMPRLVRRVEPVYPEIARQSRVQGTVILEATTDIDGRVVAVRVLRSIPLLDAAAVDAVRQWLYEPLVVNGRPRAVVFTVTLRFELK